MPLSGVCLNHDGSLEDSVFAMSSLEGSSLDDGRESRLGLGSGDALEALFSAARTERGRLRTPDCGRRCHDMVLAREGMAALGEAGFVGLAGRSNKLVDAERSDLGLKMLSCRDGSRVGLVCREPAGDEALMGVRTSNDRTDVGVFSGDSDRSRSEGNVS